MYAIRLHEYGPAANLRRESVDDPQPAAGQVRIEVKASGVQLIETWLRMGTAVGPHPAPELPVTLGGEVAGYVDQVGQGVNPAWIGKPVVASLSGTGGYAELAIAEVGDLHELPATPDFAQAAAMITTGTTAIAILELAELTAADVVLVTAAAGGIGSLLVQRARHIGATVIGAAGGRDKVERVKELGADQAVDYNSGDWTNLIEQQVTVILDGVAGDIGRAAYPLLKRGGRVVSFGAAANLGDVTPPTAPEGVEVVSLFDSPLMARLTDPAGARRLQTQALRAGSSGELIPAVVTYPLAEAARAHSDLESRKTMGKVVLVPESNPAVRQWIARNALPISDTRAAVDSTDLDALIDTIGGATVVGLGEATRGARESFTLRDRIWRRLVTERGFRALAVQDQATIVDDYDAFVRTGDGDPAELLSQAWPPWRHADMVAALEWMREFNIEHPDDQIRLFAVQPAKARLSDYDAVIDYATQVAPSMLGELESHLSPIRTAHDVDEHVQRHRGLHPGRPFFDHAQDAYRLLERLPDTPERTTALAHARTIVEFHETSVAHLGFGQGSPEQGAAKRIIDWHNETNQRIAYWDGLGHTANVDEQGTKPAEPRRFSAGGLLRRHFGTDYVSVTIGFHHGEVNPSRIPAPPSDYVDAVLNETETADFYLDLTGPAPAAAKRWVDDTHKLRVISGLYDPDKDDEAHAVARSLADWFDILIHIRTVTPTLPVE